MKMNRKNPNTTLVFCPLRVIPVVLITIAIVIIVSVVVTVIVIYIVINISTAVLFFIESWYFALIFIRYLEDQWISGPHPVYTWNCFGRVEDATNNAQEAFNGVLNRLIKVKNPHTHE